MSLIESSTPTSSPEICSGLGNRESKKKIKQDDVDNCYCDDLNEFVHTSDNQKKENEKCNMSCCFDIIEYWNRLVEEDRKNVEWNLKVSAKKNRKIKDSEVILDNLDSSMFITEEEKKHYYENKSLYLLERNNRRLLLENKFKMLKLNPNFILKPRNLKLF